MDLGPRVGDVLGFTRVVCLGFRVGGSGVVFGLPVGVFRVWCVFGVGFGVGESLARFGGWWI